MSECACTALPNTRVSGSMGLLRQNMGHDDDIKTLRYKRYNLTKGSKIHNPPHPVYTTTEQSHYTIRENRTAAQSSIENVKSS